MIGACTSPNIQLGWWNLSRICTNQTSATASSSWIWYF